MCKNKGTDGVVHPLIIRSLIDKIKSFRWWNISTKISNNLGQYRILPGINYWYINFIVYMIKIYKIKNYFNFGVSVKFHTIIHKYTKRYLQIDIKEI